mgnify:FL=1
MPLNEDIRRIESLREWLRSVNLESADVLGVEQDILRALYDSQFAFRWDFVPIAPLAEPINLNELVGDSLRSGQRELHGFAQRLDTGYQQLTDLNNSLKSEIDTVERLTVEASEAINDISFSGQGQDRDYYWVSETFNSLTFIDARTTALVDTDYGHVTLSPQALTPITNYSLSVDRSQSVGIPGCHLLVLGLQSGLVTTQEPRVTLDQSTSVDLGNITDSDPNTWFELERNFIAPKQKLLRLGRAYKSDPSGVLQGIKEATKDLDWRVYIQWPDNDFADTGPDGRGVPLAEFRDLSSSVLANQTPVPVITPLGVNRLEEGSAAVLTVEIQLTEPTVVSSLKLLPYSRNDQTIRLDRLTVFADNLEITVAQGLNLNSGNTNSGIVQSEILRRTGSQTVGAYFPVPTDRPVSKIRMVLYSQPVVAPKGLAHPFREQQVATKTTSTFLGFRSSKRKVQWSRIPTTDSLPMVVTKRTTPKLFGSLTPILDALGFAQILQTLLTIGSKPPNSNAASGPSGQSIVGSAQTVGKVFGKGGAVNLGKTAGQLGAFLGQAGTVIGGAIAVGELISGLFGTSTNKVVKATVDGYDIFDGYRAAVGIRDIGLARVAYVSESVLLLAKKQFPGPVKRIGLLVNEQIPTEWGPGEWIT